jgi:hypothetical protein
MSVGQVRVSKRVRAEGGSIENSVGLRESVGSWFMGEKVEPHCVASEPC